MMCAKPIIVNRGQATAKIVEGVDCGLVVNYGDIEELKQAINMLRNDSLRERLGKRGRMLYESKLNWKKMEERLLNVYSKVLKNNQ